MPQVKVVREDIIRRDEIRELLEAAEKGEVTYGYYSRKEKRKVIMKFKFEPEKIKALIALLELFGKRITENLRLRLNDVWHEKQRGMGKGFLVVRFKVGKTGEEKIQSGVITKYTKRITCKHPLVKYVFDWLKIRRKMKINSDYVFFGRTQGRDVTVIGKVKDNETGKLIEKEYNYHYPEEKRMSRQTAWRILKGLKADVFCHLFRHSLATKMAERGFNESRLMAWFDWKKPDTAAKYVARSGRLTQEATNRVW